MSVVIKSTYLEFNSVVNFENPFCHSPTHVLAKNAYTIKTIHYDHVR